MKKTLTLLLLLTVSLSLYSQEQRRVQISMHSGRFMAGSSEIYTDIQRNYRMNFGMDVRFFLTERFFLAAHFNHGSNLYLEDSWLTNAPGYGLNRPESSDVWGNATVKKNYVGLLAGYFLPVTQWLNVRGQIGIAQIIETKRGIPLILYRPDRENQIYVGDHRDSVTFSAGFPVKFDIGFTPFKRLTDIALLRNIELGVTAGFNISPDWGFFMGRYIAPQIAVSF